MHQYRFRERLEHGDQDRPWHLYSLPAVQGSVFPCHWHPEWELLIVERGTMVLTRNQDTQVLRTGEAVFLTGADLHTGNSDDPKLLVHALVFRSEHLRSERKDAATSHWVGPLETARSWVPGVLSAQSPPALLAKKLVEVIVGNAAGTELAVKGLLLQLMAALVESNLIEPCPQPPTPDAVPTIRGVLQWIEEHLADRLTVDLLATRSGLSPSHFSRLFKTFTGDSVIRYLITRRIAEAARLLRSGQTTVSEAALRVGFTNFSYFTRTFRSYQGVKPSETVGKSRPFGSTSSTSIP